MSVNIARWWSGSKASHRSVRIQMKHDRNRHLCMSACKLYDDKQYELDVGIECMRCYTQTLLYV